MSNLALSSCKPRISSAKFRTNPINKETLESNFNACFTGIFFPLLPSSILLFPNIMYSGARYLMRHPLTTIQTLLSD